MLLLRQESRDDVDSKDKGPIDEPTGRDFKAPAQATGDICIPDAAGIESHAVKTSIQSYRLSMAQGQRANAAVLPQSHWYLRRRGARTERSEPEPSIVQFMASRRLSMAPRWAPSGGIHQPWRTNLMSSAKKEKERDRSGPRAAGGDERWGKRRDRNARNAWYDLTKESCRTKSRERSLDMWACGNKAASGA